MSNNKHGGPILAAMIAIFSGIVAITGAALGRIDAIVIAIGGLIVATAINFRGDWRP